MVQKLTDFMRRSAKISYSILGMVLFLSPVVGQTNSTMLEYYAKEAKNCEDIPCIRKEIDAINEKILTLLAERTAYVQRAGDLKQNTKIANDPKRVADQLKVITEKSKQLGVPVSISVDTFEMLMKRSIEFEQNYIDNR